MDITGSKSNICCVGRYYVTPQVSVWVCADSKNIGMNQTDLLIKEAFPNILHKDIIGHLHAGTMLGLLTREIGWSMSIP